MSFPLPTAFIARRVPMLMIDALIAHTDEVCPAGARSSPRESVYRYARVMPRYQFSARWKEELVCAAPEGTLVIEMTMGIACVYFPDEASWARDAPPWARGRRSEILRALEAWCRGENIPVRVGPAWVRQDTVTEPR